jgi:hypothetical protein
LLAQERLVVLDEAEGPGAIACEQIWQLGPAASHFSLISSGAIGQRDSWYSPGYGSKLPGRSIVVEQAGESRVRIATTITAGTERVVPSFAETANEIEQILSSAGRQFQPIR